MDRTTTSETLRDRSKDRRLTANLHLHWYSLISGREPPALTAFDPASIPKLWPACLLAIVEDPTLPALLGDVGSALQADWSALRPGLLATDVPENTLAGQALGCVANALANREAVHLEGQFRHLNGGEFLYRAIGLPLLDAGGGLTYVLCAASGKKL